MLDEGVARIDQDQRDTPVSAILACMPVEPSSAMPNPDDFDRQLRDLTSGQAEPPKFTELSAAERLRRAPSPPPPSAKKPSRLNWRRARKARQLRKPVAEPGRKGNEGPGRAKRRRETQARPAQNAASRRRRRLLAITKTVGVVVAFAALLYGLHLLGFGPQ